MQTRLAVVDKSSMQPDPKNKNSLAPKGLIIVLLVILAILLCGGRLFYLDQGNKLRRDAEDMLTAIVHLKAHQIAAWRADLVMDATVFSQDPFFIRMAINFFVAAGDENTDLIQARLRITQNKYKYTDVMLVDAEGAVRLDLMETSEAVHPELLSCLAQSFRDHKPVISDLHKSPARTSLLSHLFFKGKVRTRHLPGQSFS